MIKQLLVIFSLSTLSSLHAEVLLNDALLRAIKDLDYGFGVAVVRMISKSPEYMAEVPKLTKALFKAKFGKNIDDLDFQAMREYDEQLKAAGNDQERLQKVFVELMTNVNQPGGRALRQLPPEFRKELGAVIAKV